MNDAAVYLAAAESVHEENWSDCYAPIAWVAYKQPNRKIMQLILKFAELFAGDFSTPKERILALLFMHQITKGTK